MSFNIPDDAHTKRPKIKRPKTKRPMTESPKDKTSQETKRPKGQNVSGTKRPKVKIPGKFFFISTLMKTIQNITY